LILDHACGVGVRPVPPPGVIDGTSFKLLVKNTPYKNKPRLDQTSAVGATLPLVHTPSPMAAASSGVGGGPFAGMMGALIQAGLEHMQARGASHDAGPTLQFGPFSRKPSTRSEASHAIADRDPSHAPTEIDPETEEDKLGKFEGDIAAARAAVKGGKRKKASESDPGEEESEAEPAGPAPKRKARKDRKAVAKAKLKAATAATAPVIKRPAAAIGPLLKRPAAAGGKAATFDIAAWLKENATAEEARAESIRRYFVSRVHHRIGKAAIRAGLPAAAVQKLRSIVSTKAGEIYDSANRLG
jgi:hypothetical protein